MNNRRRYNRLCLLWRVACVCAVAMWVSCVKNEEVVIPIADHTRTVLVYMCADNSLDSYAQTNLSEMMAGSAQIPSNCNLLVYYDGRNKAPSLYRIAYGMSEPQVVASFAENNSASPEVLAEVIDEVLQKYPAESYGLILWSHGMGWLPKTETNNSAQMLAEMNAEGSFPPVKWFGQDDANFMNLSDLQRGLPDGVFRYIVFDACLMGCVEVAFALRNKTDYLIGSAAEVIANGFPYRTLIPALFEENGEEEICRRYFEYYDVRSGSWRTATVGLVKTSELDALAETTRRVVQNNCDQIADLDLFGLQSFDRMSSQWHWQFDLDEWIEMVASEDEYAQFKNKLDQTVLYEAATPKLFDSKTVARHCGVGAYVYQAKMTERDQFYKTLDWYKAVYE